MWPRDDKKSALATDGGVSGHGPMSVRERSLAVATKSMIRVGGNSALKAAMVSMPSRPGMKINVGDQQRRGVPALQRESFTAVGSDVHLVAGRFERSPYEIADIRRVVDTILSGGFVLPIAACC